MLRGTLTFAGLLVLATSSPVTRDVATANVEAAYNTLQQWYDSSTGLWGGMWWQSANIINTYANLATIDASYKSRISNIISKTYSTVFRSPGFIGSYYDDEGWWALASIRLYDFTSDNRYLSNAETIYQDMAQTFGKTACSQNQGGTGGIWWDRAHTYVNTIPNVLFLSIAAHLANRLPAKKAQYIQTAQQQWRWFNGAGLLQYPSHLISDGLLQKNCQATTQGWQGMIWTYNSGVLLTAMTELARATSDPTYITIAQTLADAAIAYHAPDGILTDPCQYNNSCNEDQTQFKGIFIRNLLELEKAGVNEAGRYGAFIKSNAASIWLKNRNQQGQLSVNWGGPVLNPANASTHSSALDCLVAGLAA